MALGILVALTDSSPSFASFRPSIARVELDRGRAAAGETIWATYTFRCSRAADRRLMVFVHLAPPGQQYGFGGDFMPELPTTSWPAGKSVREGPFPIVVPREATPGRYRILLGVYDHLNGGRVELGNEAAHQGERRYLVGEIEVLPAGSHAKPEPVAFELLPVDPEQVCDAAHLNRKEPTRPIVLCSKELEVVMDRSDGVPYVFRVGANGERIWGEPRGGRPMVTVFRREPRGMLACEVAAPSVRASAREAAFHFDAQYEGQPAASFVLKYVLKGATLSVALEKIEERPGFELIQVELPALATVRSAEGPAWLAYPERGGQWVDLSSARPARLREATHWNFPAPVAMIGSGRTLAVLEVPSYLDTTELAVSGLEPAVRCASLGTTKAVRVPGGEKTPNLRAEQESVCRISVLSDADGDGVADWLDGAKFVRGRLPRIPSRYYDDKFVYKIFCDMPGAKEFTTFEEAARLIRSFAALTDSWPQVAYLVGWQGHGHDTAYPAVDVVNERLGGYEALMALMEDARTMNCVVSFHDNYDDAYEDSPAWNEDFIAKYPDGSLMTGGVWAGGQSYIIGMARYAAGPGLERVRYTCQRYRIRETYHLDVLSAAPLRHDWDPSHPASAVANLRGKHAIVEAFAREGVDVTSEGLSWPFIGKMSYFWNSPRGRSERFGNEVPIPLVAALYRQSAAWGGVNADGAGVLESLFYNCAFSCDLLWADDRAAGPDYPSPQWMADSFYLLQVPWFKLHGCDVESFRHDAGYAVIGFGKGTRIELDWKNLRYSVTHDGVEIARDFSTFCQLDKHRMAFYSREGRRLSAPLPAGWNGAKIVARALFADRRPEPVPVDCTGGSVTVSVAARRPVIVYGDGTPTARSRQP